MIAFRRFLAVALICLAGTLPAALVVPSAADTPAGCNVKLALPTKGNCKAVTVDQITKDHVDFYKVGNTDTPDHSVPRAAICVPFQAADCGSAKFLAVQTAGGIFLFRSADLLVQSDAPSVCTCRSERVSVAGAPGAGVPECPKEQCP